MNDQRRRLVLTIASVTEGSGIGLILSLLTLMLASLRSSQLEVSPLIAHVLIGVCSFCGGIAGGAWAGYLNKKCSTARLSVIGITSASVIIHGVWACAMRWYAASQLPFLFLLDLALLVSCPVMAHTLAAKRGRTP